MSKAEDTSPPESVSHSSMKNLNDTDIDANKDEESKKCQQFALDNLNKGKFNHL